MLWGRSGGQHEDGEQEAQAWSRAMQPSQAKPVRAMPQMVRPRTATTTASEIRPPVNESSMCETAFQWRGWCVAGSVVLAQVGVHNLLPGRGMPGMPSRPHP